MNILETGSAGTILAALSTIRDKEGKSNAKSSGDDVKMPDRSRSVQTCLPIPESIFNTAKDDNRGVPFVRLVIPISNTTAAEQSKR